MKILKEGTIPEMDIWWVGLQFTCPKCKVEFLFDELDFVVGAVEHDPKISSSIKFKCPQPGCDEQHVMAKPKRKREKPES